jgi:hypothetical protein
VPAASARGKSKGKYASAQGKSLWMVGAHLLLQLEFYITRCFSFYRYTQFLLHGKIHIMFEYIVKVIYLCLIIKRQNFLLFLGLFFLNGRQCRLHPIHIQ